jgi:hypothetical protein
MRGQQSGSLKLKTEEQVHARAMAGVAEGSVLRFRVKESIYSMLEMGEKRGGDEAAEE